MSARVEWRGLNEFLTQFSTMVVRLNSEGLEIVREETEGAAQEIRHELSRAFKSSKNLLAIQTQYPGGADNLLIGIVRNAAPHAHLVEFGTEVRYTKKGAHRGQVQPQSPKITPTIARRRRARMARALADMLRRHGFEVSTSGGDGA